MSTAGFSHAVVGVTDLEEAMDLWVNTFGLAIFDQRIGPDEALSDMWGLPEDEIAAQALVGIEGSFLGRVHLVQFAHPGPVVRANAVAYDLCPKNLDLRVRDLHQRYEELVQAGWALGSAPVRLALEGEVYEVHLKGPDAMNYSLVEVVGSDLPYTEHGYLAVTQFVATTSNNIAESEFFGDVFGLSPISHHVLEGPEIESMIGLPPGTKLDMRILGHPDQPLGAVELVEYVGVIGNDLYPTTSPPARGFLGVSFSVDDLDGVAFRAVEAGSKVIDIGTLATITGSGRRLRITSPSGLQIELVQS